MFKVQIKECITNLKKSSIFLFWPSNGIGGHWGQRYQHTTILYFSGCGHSSGLRCWCGCVLLLRRTRILSRLLLIRIQKVSFVLLQQSTEASRGHSTPKSDLYQLSRPLQVLKILWIFDNFNYLGISIISITLNLLITRISLFISIISIIKIL